MMKLSGSKKTRLLNRRYADERQLQYNFDLDELPHHESIKKGSNIYGGKINYGPLVRFLRGQVGNNWDGIYAEFCERIPTKLLHHKDMIFMFVADKVEFIDGRPWNKRKQQFIWTGEELRPIHYTQIKQEPQRIEFYVDPNTNTLVRIEQRAFKRLIKKNNG